MIVARRGGRLREARRMKRAVVVLIVVLSGSLASAGIADAAGISFASRTAGCSIGCVSGDFNGDGRLDLATSSFTSSPGGGFPSAVTVLLRNADGTYSSDSIATGDTDWSLTTDDFNGDGHPDL